MVYNGKLVCRCCENCLHAGEKGRWDIKCSITGKPHHSMTMCEHYEFSPQRFDGKATAAPDKEGE